jgi:carboxymethylenebutenolidase
MTEQVQKTGASGGDAQDGVAIVPHYSGNAVLNRSKAMTAHLPEDDLVAVWEEHLRQEFEVRNADAPTDTMAPEPYVNHVPTMTGGLGIKELKRFYKYHFVTANPDDIEIVPISRTVGGDSIVDEMVVRFTHTRVVDYLLPGVAPTGLRVEIPAVVVARFRSGKLASEHIYWDQASVLVQLGKLNPAGLPVAGVEVARKALDRTLPSNQLMAREWGTSEGKPS